MAITFNADTTNGAVITSDTSGEIKLQSAGADIATVSSTGITMASGKNLITTAPAFSATNHLLKHYQLAQIQRYNIKLNDLILIAIMIM